MKKQIVFIAVFCIILSACGDPYQQKITPPLTPAQAEKLATKLPEADKDIFLRWAKRSATGEKYGGEGSVSVVKDAIVTQQIFEARQADAYEQEKSERSKAEKIAKEEQAKLELQRQQLVSRAEHRRKVHERIVEAIDGKFLSYSLKPQFDHYNRPIGNYWVFVIEFKNKTKKEIIGLAGYVTIEDAFGVNLGSYPLRLETSLKDQKPQETPLIMDFNRNDKFHLAMRESQRLTIRWFFESLVFRDGTRIDDSTIERSSVPAKSKTS